MSNNVFNNWSDLMLSGEWAAYVVKWKRALLNWPLAKTRGFDSENDVEELFVRLFNIVVAKGIHKLAFDQLSPDLFTLDGKEWASLSPQPKEPVVIKLH